MYSEAKLAFFIYLWHPKTKGTDYVYNFSLRPYMARHEKELDRNLLELSVKAKEIGVLVCKEAASYAPKRFLHVMHYFSSQQNCARKSTIRKQSEYQQRLHDEIASEANSLTPIPVEAAAASKDDITVSEQATRQQAQTPGKWRTFRANR